MSVVTDVLLTGGLELEDMVAMVNLFFDPGPGLAMVDGRQVGGSKCLQATVLIGAFNYLDLSGFVAHLRELPWPRWSTERIRLFVQEENDECGFHEVEIWP